MVDGSIVGIVAAAACCSAVDEISQCTTAGERVKGGGGVDVDGREMGATVEEGTRPPSPTAVGPKMADEASECVALNDDAIGVANDDPIAGVAIGLTIVVDVTSINIAMSLLVDGSIVTCVSTPPLLLLATAGGDVDDTDDDRRAASLSESSARRPIGSRRAS